MVSPRETDPDREGELAVEGLVEAAFESAPVGIALLTADGDLVRANRTLADMAGRPLEELAGTRLSWVPDAFSAAFERALRAEDGQSAADADLPVPGGRRLPVKVRIEAVRGRDGATLGAVAYVAERLATEHGQAGERDPLTGLITRAELERRFAAMLAAGERGALLRVDIDDFEAVNEHYGHRVGDQVLISIGEELRHCVRRSDEVARVGGDEFALLLRDADRAGAKKVGGAVMAALARIRFGENRSLEATVGFALTGEGENRSGHLASLLAEATRQRVSPSEPRVAAAGPKSPR